MIKCGRDAKWMKEVEEKEVEVEETGVLDY